MKYWLFPTVALLLAGPATAQRAGPPPVKDGYDWAIRIDEGRVSSAILAYEVDGTDDQPLNFSCEQGGNRIFASISGGDPALRGIVLSSGPQSLRLPGTTEANEDEPPHFTSQEIAGASPFLRAFAANGWLRMTALGQTTGMTGTAAGKQAIKRFVEFCTR
jgi:hypothetical protein